MTHRTRPGFRSLLPRSRGGALAVPLLLLIAAPAAAEDSRCEIRGTRVAESDRALAHEACALAIGRFTELFGAPPPSGTIEITDTVQSFVFDRTHPDWRILWPSTPALHEFFRVRPPAAGTVEEAVARHWAAVLPHEVGHLMLTAHAFARQAPDAVGLSLRLPAWLHEGVAIHLEPPGSRDDDFAIARAHLGIVPELERLLRRSNPAAAADRPAGATYIVTHYPCATEELCGGRPRWWETMRVHTHQSPEGVVTVDTTFLAALPPGPDPLVTNFYAYSGALVMFIRERGGADALNTLLDRYAREPERPDALVGLPGLPADGAALDRAWDAWFRERILGETVAG